MIGQTLGRYRILETIGAGGMGEVYRSKDEQLGRNVAIKVLAPVSLNDVTARARLLGEARAAAALNHPHICTVYEVGDADGRAYIAMEYVEGQTLNLRLTRAPFSLEQILQCGLQIADGLAHAHERSVIHRDLKPGNIMVNSDGRTKVLDFGLAKRLTDLPETGTHGSQTALTDPGTVVGTIAYMAPEQLRGEAADARSDIWALGVVLYELLTSARPFKASTTFALSGAILHDSPAPLPPNTPSGLRAVIQKCLAKDPSQRYQRAGEVRAALEAILAGLSGQASAEEPKPLTSFAVLPFAFLNDVEERRALSLGFADSLITMLSSLEDIIILPTASILN